MGSTLLWGILVAAALFAGVYFLSRPRPRVRSVDELRRELERMTNDPAVADRLIARMRARHPEASMARLYALAIAELRADRR